MTQKLQLVRPRLLVAVTLVLWLLWRRSRAAKNCTKGPMDSRPTIVFSGSFLLMAVYLGFAAYLQDHFKLDNVRFSGVSGGTTNFFSIILKANVAKLFELGMQMRRDLLSRPLLCYLIPESWLIDRLVKQARVMGFTDKATRQISQEGRAFFGVTTISWTPLPWPKLRILSAAETLTDTCRQMMQSCTVLPFFARPGVLPDGKLAFDGGFSAIYATPDDADPETTIRVTPWPFIPADIKLHWLGFFDWVSALYPMSMQQQIKLFSKGYHMGQQGFDVLSRKGLVPLPAPRGTLQKHLDAFEEVAILRTSRNKRTSRSVQDMQADDFQAGSNGLGKMLQGDQRSKSVQDLCKGP